MTVKYWSAAGLCLTDWCNARCASCYLACRPERQNWMDVETALRVWRELSEFSPHGCRVHLAGGEPFGDLPRLLEIIRRADAEGLTECKPLEKVETNAFWATNDAAAREVIEQLAETSMGLLLISADPFHQQYVPLECVKRAMAAAEDILGEGRWRVRWQDWVQRDVDMMALDASGRERLFAEWIAEGRDRLNGRAAEVLAGTLPKKPAEAFVGQTCREGLLRGKHVHVLPDGSVYPGTCAGIVLGNVHGESIAEMWRRLGRDYAERPVLGRLIAGGPVALLELAEDLPEAGVDGDGYASKCHLCWSVRKRLAAAGRGGQEIAPAWVYQEE